MSLTLERLKRIKDNVISKPTPSQLYEAAKSLSDYEISHPIKHRINDSLTITMPYLYYYFWDIKDVDGQWEIWQKKVPREPISRNGFRCMQHIWKHCKDNFTPAKGWQMLTYD